MSEQAGLAAVALGVAAASGLGLVGLIGFGLHSLGLRRLTRGERRAAFACVLLLAAEGAAFGWGLLEARWLEVTRLELPTAKLAPGARLRIVHLSDLHAEAASPLLDGLADRVNALEPDLVVFTGDTLNEEQALPAVRRLFAGIRARYGLFAVRGNWDTALWANEDLFSGVATELRGRPLTLPELGLTLCGDFWGNGGSLEGCLRSAPEGLRVVAYHTPDLVEELARLEPDLYLAGHTHGGQVRLPFWGAVVTMSSFGKRYEAGLYQVGASALYVSRGLGTEGGDAPPVRFLCRPELAVIDLVGAAR